MVCSGIYWVFESRAEGRYALGRAGSIARLEFGAAFRIRGLPLKQAVVKIWHALTDLLRFNPSYWFVVGLCFTFYSGIFPFRTFAIDFFTNKILASHGGVLATEVMRVQAHEQAGFFNSLLPLSAMVATPLFGLLSRQDRETGIPDDVRLDPVDACLPVNGLFQRFSLCAGLYDGNRFLVDPCG